MRQKDIDQLADIWAKDIEFADAVELPGIEVAIGALVRPLAYNADRYHPLDMGRLEALIDTCKARQGKPVPMVRDCHADGVHA